MSCQVGCSNRGWSANVIPWQAEAPRSIAEKEPDSQSEALYRLGLEQEKAGEFEAAFELYQKAATLGHTHSQLSVGDFYQIGRGVDQSNQNAITWYKSAAVLGKNEEACLQAGELNELEGDWEDAMYFYNLPFMQNNSKAQYRLGCLKLRRAKEGDSIHASALVRSAALQGHSEAQYQLGYMYEEGMGVPKNEQEAIHFYRLAASNGHPEAQFRLGLRFQSGQGVEQSDTQAARLFAEAAIQDHAKAQCNLGYLYAKGRGVKQNNQKAVRLYRAAAKSGAVKARCNLAHAYMKGRGVRQSDRKAIKHYQLAAEAGSLRAQRYLDFLQLRQKGVQDESLLQVESLSLNEGPIKAHKVQNAASQEGLDRLSNVALIYEASQASAQRHQRIRYEWAHDGEPEHDRANMAWINETKRRSYQANLLKHGSQLDDRETFEWYRQRADKGNSLALYRLSLCYKEGRGVEQDLEQASALLRRAAEQGAAEAQYEIGRTDPDKKGGLESIQWYRRAAEQGHVKARLLLRDMLLRMRRFLEPV